MKLDNFYLIAYNENEPTHQKVIEELYLDHDGRKYLGSLDYQLQVIAKRKEENIHNNAYIAYYNEEPIGYISLTYKNDRYFISYGIRPTFRGEYLGSLLLQEFSEKLFAIYPDIDKLSLMIDNLNTGSKKTAFLAGYEQESENIYGQQRM